MQTKLETTKVIIENPTWSPRPLNMKLFKPFSGLFFGENDRSGYAKFISHERLSFAWEVWADQF